ncbi:hypothetical protein F7734_09965 [Scytonema sp. UIC 10036]|uniref:hypothetical protein n=1 Tax=Scytonema sp. UIC 10036 TaxID=2304196 RepID=UPI0012DA7311|nr:hypothetical protein [Scytonema sp. UIC 10036]MUG92757.1 hypothetical protein [Scytonema sp. UIC 10036]
MLYPNQTPNWQPVSKLPLIAQMIDGGLAQALTQYQNLQQAQSRSHILDSQTVERVLKVFGEQMKFTQIVYSEQLSRWKAENLNATQQTEIARLEGQLEQMGQVISNILTLANQLKEGTIEKVFEKSDIEIAMDIISGKQNI